jgi:hypothetical protein
MKLIELTLFLVEKALAGSSGAQELKFDTQGEPH